MGDTSTEVAMRLEACIRHNLWFAYNPVPSADGRLIYLVCGCGQPRVVPAEAWHAEEVRRLTSKHANMQASMQEDDPHA